MAAYRLLIKPSAAKELDTIRAKRDRERIVDRILALATDPRPAGCEKLAGHPALFRLRQGNFRIVYAVVDARRSVEVVKVGHRREVYREIP